MKVSSRDGTPLTNSHWDSLTDDKQILAVDFDHTISTKCFACLDGLKDDRVQEGCVEALKKLSKTFQIWIFTGNYEYLSHDPPVKRSVHAIEAILKTHGIPFDRILQTKPPAMFIVDDRAIHHTSWTRTLREIRSRVAEDF